MRTWEGGYGGCLLTSMVVADDGWCGCRMSVYLGNDDDDDHDDGDDDDTTVAADDVDVDDLAVIAPPRAFRRLAARWRVSSCTIHTQDGGCDGRYV